MADEPSGEIITLPSSEAPERSLSHLMPRNVRELAYFGNQAAASGLFKTSAGRGQGLRNITGQEAFLLMSQGVELGLSPLQSLRELNIIDGRVDVPASVRAAKIAASPKVTQWEVNATPSECTITAKRSDRATHCSVHVRLADMNQRDVDLHKAHLEDWLYARAVRKISRRYFPDFALGLDTASEEYDPSRIIDVSAVEQHIGVADQTAPHGYHEGCGGVWELATNTRTGGAFLRCPRCNTTAPPPQAVRDAIRGVPPALTIAASQAEEVKQAEPAPVSGTDVILPPSEEPEGAPENEGGGSDAEPGGGASISGFDVPGEVHDSEAIRQLTTQRTGDESVGEAHIAIVVERDYPASEPLHDEEHITVETQSLPETEAAPSPGVASTPTDAPEAVAELAMIQWRARARSAIAKYAGEHRTAETGRAQVVEALQSQGWDLIKPLAAFLRDASDEAIATLIGAFKIDVPHA